MTPRRCGPNAAIAIVLLGHLGVIAAGMELWPFSDYNMYSRRADAPGFHDAAGPDELIQHRVVGIFQAEGAPPKERLVAPGGWRDDVGPLNPELLQRAIGRQLRHRRGEVRPETVLSGLFAWYRAQQAQGRLPGPPLQRLRVDDEIFHWDGRAFVPAGRFTLSEHAP